MTLARFTKLARFFALPLLFFSSLAQANPSEIRAILHNELPSLYSPLADHPATADEMQNGAESYVDHMPWAMPHMGYKTGMLATRSLDETYMKLATTALQHAYFTKHNLKSILALSDATERQRQINLLSPAEKYDLAIGDLDQGFSKAIWEEVERQFAKGDAPTWLGLCDGSSSASLRFAEPTRAVTVQSRISGVEVQFNVGDIKSLLAFSMTTYVAQDLPIFGKRCSGTDANGNQCQGINPASFHEILLQMGENPETFPYMIVDRSPKNSIWNAALLSASLSYYNPETQTSLSDRAEDNLVDPTSSQPPEGSPGWAPGTRYLLFTATTLRLADTRTPIEFNAEGDMATMDLPIKYILELDEKLDVLGGEWLTAQHPGFIWALSHTYRPASVGDRQTALYKWVGTAIPDAAMPAVLSSSRQLQPLFHVIDFIYQQSK